MLGAIAGDIIGSVYEFNNIRNTDFPLFSDRSEFTDDTVLTIATADCILNNGKYPEIYKKYFRKYPGRGDSRSILWRSPRWYQVRSTNKIG